MFQLLSDHQDPVPTPSASTQSDKSAVKGHAKRSHQGGSRGKAVPLHSWEEYQIHLEEVQELLWTNCGWMNSKQYHFMWVEILYIEQSVSMFL